MLSPGTRLEHYEIISTLGVGGMGEVYRARDTKLGRDVAFKVLPEVFSSDPERLWRFQREAQVLAALNHPAIAHIYGVVESNGIRSIVMELVQGETLQERLKSGPIKTAEALHIGKQIAEALEAAHDRGIIHRDLKPGNIMITADGAAKVLDFGLAKAAEGREGDSDVSQSPTLLTAAHTQPNVLLGTAAYMSPEQIRGHRADERADVWAFGCVLYEMLSGRRAFAGDNITDLVAEIVRIEPDWAMLPADASAYQSIVKGCLEKSRKQRFHAIGDVRIEIEKAQRAQSSQAAPIRQSRERLAWGLAAVFVLATIGTLVGAFYFYPAPLPTISARFLFELPPEAGTVTVTHSPEPAVSPDGRYISFVSAASGSGRLWIRPIDQLDSRIVTGTEGLTLGAYPFWSSDSRYIGFFAGGKLMKVAVAGGPPTRLCDAVPSRSEGRGGTWNQNDIILFIHNGALHRVHAGGGTSEAIRTADKSKKEVGLTTPSFLPDGRHFFYIALNSERDKSELRVGDLEDKNNDRVLRTGNSQTIYAHPGHILFVRDETLMAQQFDTDALVLKGDAFPIADRIAFEQVSGMAAFSVSSNGILVYRNQTVATASELAWFDKKGNKTSSFPSQGVPVRMSLSPDQTQIAMERRDGPADIWMLDLSRAAATKITRDPADDLNPVFSPDGKQIAFTSVRNGTWGIYLTSASGRGNEELLQVIPGGANPQRLDWSRDGQWLIYDFMNQNGNSDVWALPMTGTERKPKPVLNQPVNEVRAQLSPDSQWILYDLSETATVETYVSRFPPTEEKWRISIDGGSYAHWRQDGKQIIFRGSDGKLMAVDVTLGKTFRADIPKPLFDLPGGVTANRYAMAPDAQRFFMPVFPGAGADKQALNVVFDWTSAIPKKR